VQPIGIIVLPILITVPRTVTTMDLETGQEWQRKGGFEQGLKSLRAV